VHCPAEVVSSHASFERLREGLVVVSALGYPQHHKANGHRQCWEKNVKRYFEFVDDASSKFWETWVEDTTLSVRFGKIGTNGQTTVKEFPDTGAAEQARDKAIAEKTRKGYVEVTPNTTTTTNPEKDWDDFFVDSETGLVIELDDHEGELIIDSETGLVTEVSIEDESSRE
jgi:predicted DNA-binding WGR domain protein